jgi:hypothetical protein
LVPDGVVVWICCDVFGVVWVGDNQESEMSTLREAAEQALDALEWQSLTDEEIASIFTGKDATWWKPFARAIEAALKEKNT